MSHNSQIDELYYFYAKSVYSDVFVEYDTIGCREMQAEGEIIILLGRTALPFPRKIILMLKRKIAISQACVQTIS
jgi:hypothetical protein